MKKTIRLLSAVLSAACLLTLPALAEGLGNLGKVIYMYSETVSGGLEYKEVYSIYNDNSPEHSFIFEYTPGEGTLPLLSYGESIYGAESVSTLCDYEESKGIDIRGGMNADFFSLQTGVPLGAVIKDGRLMSSCSGNNAMGFRTDGSYVFGTPSINISLTHNENTYKITNYNKYPTIYVEYLLSSDYYPSTNSQSESTEIVLEFPEISPKLNESYYCRVLEVYKDVCDTKIPDGCLVLSVNNKSVDFENFASIEAGDTVRLDFKAEEVWSDVDFAFSGSDIIIKDSEIQNNIVDQNHEKVRNPRTAAGVRSDGTFVFYAVDGGKNENSSGYTLMELADVMKSLGCVYAMNLDGGGSTTVCVKLGANGKAKLVNSPSGGSQRKVSNAILFANQLKPTGIPGNAIVNLSTPYVLSENGYVDVNLSVLDTAYHSMSGEISNLTIVTDTYLGEIKGNRIYPSCDAGHYNIYVTADVDGIQVKGKATLNVVNSIDALEFEGEEIYINRGGTAVLPLIGHYNSLPVAVAAESLKLSFIEKDENGNDIVLPSKEFEEISIISCDAGYIDFEGVFHGIQDGKNHSVTVKAEYGDLVDYYKINVGISPAVIGVFEDGSDLTEIYRTGNGEYSYVDFGQRSSHSVRFIGTDFRYIWQRVLSKNCSYLEIWLYGKYDNDAYCEISDHYGNIFDIKYELKEDYTSVNGWSRLVAKIPEDTAQTISINSIYKTNELVNVILDNFTINYGDEAYVFSDIDSSWAKEHVLKSYNMGISDGTIIDGERFFYPENNLTRAEFAKFFAAFLGLDIRDDGFTLTLNDIDTIPDWSLPYVKAMIKAGFMSGKEQGDKINFCANDKITREEVIYVFGKLIPSSYSVELSFNDNDNIAIWSRDNIKKAIGFGLVSGYGDNTLLPKKNITRAEVISIFVRAMESGLLEL